MQVKAIASTNVLFSNVCKDSSMPSSLSGMTSRPSTLRSTSNMSVSRMETSTGLFQANSWLLWDQLRKEMSIKDMDTILTNMSIYLKSSTLKELLDSTKRDTTRNSLLKKT